MNIPTNTHFFLGYQTPTHSYIPVPAVPTKAAPGNSKSKANHYSPYHSPHKTYQHSDMLVSKSRTPIPKQLYRGDDRSPNTIFSEGFKPRKTNSSASILQHLQGAHSNYISFTESKEIALNFALRGTNPFQKDNTPIGTNTTKKKKSNTAYIYYVRSGKKANFTYPYNEMPAKKRKKSISPHLASIIAHEKEVTSKGGVPRRYIKQAEQINAEGQTIKIVKNPHYTEQSSDDE